MSIPFRLGLTVSLTVLAACRPPSPSGQVRAAPSPTAPAAAGAATEEPSRPVRHDVVADGHPLAVWEKRRGGEQRAVVLVHGRTWSALPDFDLQVPGERLSLMDALVEHGYSVYAVDLRGYGGTPRDETGWLTPNRAVEDLAIVLDWVATRGPDSGRPVLLGWSMGSLVSQLCVQRHSDRVSALVLFGYPRKVGWKAPRRDTPPAPPREPTTAEAAAEDFITPGTISKEAIDAYVQAALEADPVRADWTRLHEFDELDAARVKVPTLVIHGDRDPYAPTENQRELVERLGASRKQLVTLPGLDHAAHLEDLETFTREVVSFVEES
jgi:pimeloyl-ACP methyl ester carboxylesterase